MVRSGMPIHSFLCVLGALLMLFPQLLLGTSPGLSMMPVTDPEVQRALPNLVWQYNHRRRDSHNYYKVLRVVQTKQQVINGKLHEYYFKVNMVKTTCVKQNHDMIYKSIQKCHQLPGNQQKPTCYFKVIPGSPPTEVNLAVNTCT